MMMIASVSTWLACLTCLLEMCKQRAVDSLSECFGALVCVWKDGNDWSGNMLRKVRHAITKVSPAAGQVVQRSEGSIL